MAHINKIENQQLNNVLIALRALCLREYYQNGTPPGNLWPSTRDVAECCDISIYIARYYLIKLVESNKAYVIPCLEKNNSLRWYIAGPMLITKQRKQKTRNMIVR